MSPTTATFPTPAEMIAHLDRFIMGQTRAKRDVATAVYNHYMSIAYRHAHPGVENPFGKNHVLMLGPTGSGKSHLVMTLARFLRVPFVFINAKSLVEAGYVGNQVDSILKSLLARTQHDVELAQRGIAFIDEIDKIRRSVMGDRDVSGEGVQNSLLALLDGRPIGFRVSGTDSSTEMDTSQILFIGAGAFVGLTDIVRARCGSGRRIGYSHSPSRLLSFSEDEALENLSPEDLEAFGFIPELIGRFTMVTPFRSLGADDYVRILTDVEESALRQQKRLFALNGVALSFSPGAIEAIARQATRTGLGVRGLEKCVKETLGPVSWRLSDLAGQGISRVLITEEVVCRGAPPILEEARGPVRPRTEELRQMASRLLKLEPDSGGGKAWPNYARAKSADRKQRAFELQKLNRSRAKGKASPGGPGGPNQEKLF